MKHSFPSAHLEPADIEILCDLLDREEREYRRLLRLAWRQNGYLRRQDLQRLEMNADQWQKYLPLADAARIKREEFLSDLSLRMELGDERRASQYLIECADIEYRQILREAVQRLIGTASDLNRQNELNRHLADFCLDLTREEAEIFKQGVLEDPVGCYEDDAQKSKSRPGKVIIRQA
jgi:hypothetical protein